ncbi:hypothetical protein CU633_12545 [Bacillus sp. V3-13]|uniref:SDR family NAD(P)-dependent oxidoreductase n=1 Tax=Bacillus sp. V3-13 TaxID=2053728 RepID=UPI000C7742FC|nr:SDR family oxidoreductase [Bacillus sp. V3-13]PLR77040.1 hypothetical protein CU633_12545 [Bacillus sp. V3-13]
MNRALEGEAAIITGSASGIGKGIAHDFLKEGASVLLVDIKQEHLELTKKELADSYPESHIVTVSADLTNIEVMDRVVEQAIKSFQRIDILINCAGIYPVNPAFQIDEQAWDSVMDLNLKGTFFLCQTVARKMIEQTSGGRIVNITSTASEVARPGVAHYCASKAAVKMLTQVLALEWAEYGIRVNSLGPGLVETETVLQTLTDEKAIKEHKEKLLYCPMSRTALVEEISKGVLFLASNQSTYVTGQSLLVDGGYSAGRVFQSLKETENAVVNKGGVL